MGKTDLSNIAPELTVERINAVRSLVSRYHSDSLYRRQVHSDPVSAFRAYGIELPSNLQIRVEANTSDRIYVVMPPDPNSALGDEALAAVAGGGDTTGTGSSISSVGTVNCSTLPGTLSSYGSVATAGSA